MLLYVCLRDKSKHIVGRFNQSGIAPATGIAFGILVVLRAQGCHFVCGLQGEIFLIGIIPLHGPALHALGNAIGGLFLRQGGILKVSQFVAESHSIVVEADDQTDIIAERAQILVGLIAALQTFTSKHLIVFLQCSAVGELAGSGSCLKTYVGNLNHLLSLIVNHQTIVFLLNRYLSVWRDHLLCLCADDTKYCK